MMKRLLALTLSLVLIFGISASAAVNFSDVTSESHPWAIKEISEMADKKIINGYPDGTFMPNNNVTKQEALLLIARILGYSTSQTIDDYINSIYNTYADDMASIDSSYKREMAFLAWYGVFKPDELKKIQFTAPLTREEAAYYITRAMRQDEDAASFTIPSDVYTDDSLISSTYKKYVYFVRAAGYMTGSGEGGFTPKDNITRAQTAVLLYRIMNKITTSFSKATVDSVNVTKNTGKVFIGSKTVDIDDSVLVRNRGVEINISSLYKNLDGVAILENDKIVQLDVFFDESEVAKTIDGEVVSYASTGTNSIVLKDPDTDTQENYYLDENCRIFVNNSDAVFANVRKGDYVILDLDSNDRIVTLTVKPSISDVSDVIIKDIIVTNTDTSLVVENKAGEEETYMLTGKNITIKKNGKAIDISNLSEGDKLSKISMKYGRITSIDAFSEVSSKIGSITEILISQNPTIKVLDGNTTYEYKLTRDTQIYVFGELKDVYALKLAYKANITLDGNIVSKIEVATQSQSNDAKGIVESVNTSYGFFVIRDAEGNSVQVFVSNTKTKIIDNNSTTGLTKTIRDIKVGQSITAIGTLVNGAFEAQTVVLTK